MKTSPFFLGALASALLFISASVQAQVTTLTWDPGSAQNGTNTSAVSLATGAEATFKVTTQTTAVGAWRTILRVTSGSANLYLRKSAAPTEFVYDYASENPTGSQGIVLSPEVYNAGEEWFILVKATSAVVGTVWSGEQHAISLGEVSYDDTNLNNQYDPNETIHPFVTGNLTIGGEGALYYKATVPAGVPAWVLWAHGATRQIQVRKLLVPLTGDVHDVVQSGRMLLVPEYLQPSSAGGTYYIRIAGTPGQTVNLTSQLQPISTLGFSTEGQPLASVTVTSQDAGYSVFQVNVPSDQLGWEVSAAATSGAADLSVRREKVGNEFAHTAASAVAGGAVVDSITLAPSTLTNGPYYVTLWSESAATYQVSLTSGTPVVTTVTFLGSSTNSTVPAPPNALTKTGWRYYVVPDIDSQTFSGFLGWQLNLASQVPGTEIALRRNALPARWNAWNGGAYAPAGEHVDFSSTTGVLQRAGHQADVWYIGIYTPAAALGNFILTRTQIGTTTLAFDGASSSTTATLPDDGTFKYYRVDVAANANLRGWDLRARWSGAGAGTPEVYVTRNVLPTSGSLFESLPVLPTTGWPLGLSIALGTDWTGLPVDADGTHRTLGAVMPLNAPLEPGTYYIGIRANAASTTVTLDSSGIGTSGYEKVVNAHPGTSGTNVTITALAAREAAYYSYVVPAGVPSLEFTLTDTFGQVFLAICKDRIPGIAASEPASILDGHGKRMDRFSTERMLILPASGQAELTPGTYYLAVVSQGGALSANQVGSMPANAVLGNTRPVPVLAMTGVASPSTQETASVPLQAGQSRIVDFTVTGSGPATAVQVSLTDAFASDSAAYSLIAVPGTGIPAPPIFGNEAYGVEGGQNAPGYISSSGITTFPNLPNGTYRLLLRANPAYDQSQTPTLTVSLTGPQPLTFDGGTTTVTAQPGNTWRFFQITVPAGVLGWDVQVKNITNSFNMQTILRRGILPGGGDEVGDFTGHSGGTTWPMGQQLTFDADWTGSSSDIAGLGHRGVVIPMGRPLQANTAAPGDVYYLGVFVSDGGSDYEVQSRGIGAVQSIVPMVNASTTGATTSGTNVQPWDFRVVQFTVAPGLPSLELKLEAVTGDMALAVRRGEIPGSESFQYGDADIGHGVLMNKPGTEYFTLLPEPGQSTLTAGTYYAAVISQGDGGSFGTAGVDPASFTFNYNGPLVAPASVLVTSGGVSQSFSAAAGQLRVLDFEVPVGALGLEYRISEDADAAYTFFAQTNGAGTAPGSKIPAPPDWSSDSYGFDGGQTEHTGASFRQESGIITLAAPQPGLYRFTIRGTAPTTAPSGTLNARILLPQTLTFHDGNVPVTGHTVGTWRYFAVTVPSDAQGWDIRLTEGEDADLGDGLEPQLDFIIRKQSAPTENFFNLDRPSSQTAWADGDQWEVTDDWTDFGTGQDGKHYTGAVIPRNAPLVPGLYYVGIRAHGSPVNYRMRSFGIGSTPGISFTDLGTTGIVSATAFSTPAREFRHYKVTLPANLPSWEFVLDSTLGDAALAISRSHIPGIDASDIGDADVFHGVLMRKDGPERYLLLPGNGESFVPAGEYYITVISQGVNPNAQTDVIGSGSTDGTFTAGPLPVTNVGTLTTGSPLTQPVLLLGGQVQAFEFDIGAGVELIEVRLDNRTSNPAMSLLPVRGSGLPQPVTVFQEGYGIDGGQSNSGNFGLLADSNILLFPVSGTTGMQRLMVRTLPDGSGYPNAAADLVITSRAFTSLAFSPAEANAGTPADRSGSLTGNQKTAFKVSVPMNSGGGPVIGWQLTLATITGNATMVVYPLANLNNRTEPLSPGTHIFSPDFLVPGSEFVVELTGIGGVSYHLFSNNVTLQQPAFVMPSTVDTDFGDTGASGVDLPGGNWHFYAVTIPQDNPGILRTALEAINGDPNLYIGEGFVPSLAKGNISRRLDGPGSQVGNWVPANGRESEKLTPGTWYLGVHASATNCRYRLRLRTGQITSLPSLDQASNQTLNLTANDFRYFRFTVPDPAPSTWTIQFSRILGDALMFVRDTLPPGDTFNASTLADWSTDSKNQGFYLSVAEPGSHTLSTPPLRPGSVYYLGFRGTLDSTIDITSTTTAPGPTIQSLPYSNAVHNFTLPGNSTLALKTTVPPGAARFKFTATHSSDVIVSVEQGTLAQATPGEAHHRSNGADTALDVDLGPATWPWLAGKTYYFMVQNTSSSSRTFDLHLADLTPTWANITHRSFITATGSGVGPDVKVFYGESDLTPTNEFQPFAGSFQGGVTVASGDVNGDGVPDIITGASTLTSHVKVIDGSDGSDLRSFFAFAPTFTGGVNVAAGDVNGDGQADIIVGAGPGSGPHVKVFNGETGAEIMSFFPYAANFAGGVRVAAGDVNGDGRADIITASGPGVGQHVKAFSGNDGAEIRSFFAYNSTFAGGVNVATGDVDGDGRPEIITGTGSGTGGGHVKVFDGITLAEQSSFFAYNVAFTGGVRVASGDVNGDGIVDIIVGPESSSGHVKVFNGTTVALLASFFPHSPSFAQGLHVAAAPLPPRPEIVVENGSTELFDGTSTLDFGSVTTGTTVTRTLTVRNVGTAPLTGLGVAIPDFVTTGFGAASISSSLNPGQSLTFLVSFNPSTTLRGGTLLTLSSNDADEGSFDIALDGIGVAPGPATFTQHPQSRWAFIGSSVQFTVQLTGASPVTQQWRKGTTNLANGTAISGVTTTTLTINNLKTTDAQRYNVRATAGIGSPAISNDALLGIATRGPARVDVKETAIATLTATATAPTGVTILYAWLRNNISLGNNGRFSGTDTKTLKISGILNEDEGTYTCRLTMLQPTGNIVGFNGDTFVNVVQKPTVPAFAIAPAMVSEPVTIPIPSTNEPTKFAVTGAPPGIILNADTGVLSGRATAARYIFGAAEVSYLLKITATNLAGTSTVREVPWLIKPLSPSLIGTFYGLVDRSGIVNSDLGGTFTATTLITGRFSGSLLLAGMMYPFDGALDTPEGDDPTAVVQVKRTPTPLTPLHLTFSIETGANRLSGELDDEEFRETQDEAALGDGTPGDTDGNFDDARFNIPRGIVLDGDGNGIIADTGNHTLRFLDTELHTVSTVAGTSGTPGSTNGDAENALFSGPEGMAFDSLGNLFVADTGNACIRKITNAGVVTTFAGSAGLIGSVNGTGTAARFMQPCAIAIDLSNNLIVADRADHTLRKITPTGVVTTLAGKSLTPGTANGSGAAARFNAPNGVCFDPVLNAFFVADTQNASIRKVTATGAVTTYAGETGVEGGHDGLPKLARFEAPYAITSNGAGTLFVADSLIVEISKGGVVGTISDYVDAANESDAPRALVFEPAEGSDDATVIATDVSLHGVTVHQLSFPIEKSFIEARKNIWSATNKANAYKGLHNVGMEPIALTNPPTPVPDGDAYVTLNVSDTGTVTVGGKLADNTTLTGTVPLGPDGRVPLHQMLYTGTGSMQGYLFISNTNGDVQGQPSWTKIPQPLASTTRSYIEGWPVQSFNATGGRWATTGTNIFALLGLNTGTNNTAIQFSLGGLTAPFSKTFSITAPNTVTFLATTDNPNKVTLTITPGTGLFSGKFEQSGGRKADFFGALWKNQSAPASRGSGFFNLPGTLPTPTTSEILSGTARIVPN